MDIRVFYVRWVCLSKVFYILNLSSQSSAVVIALDFASDITKEMVFCCWGEEAHKRGLFGDSWVANGNNHAASLHRHHSSISKESQVALHAKAKEVQAKRRQSVHSQPVDLTCAFEHPSYPKSETELNFIDEALGDNFIFSSLNSKERTRLIGAMKKEEARAGTNIITQGEDGEFFYIVERGIVAFIADGENVGSCGIGASFGELALLYDAPRAATCLAQTDCSLWKVDQYTFRHMLARQANLHERNLCDVLKKVELFNHLAIGDLHRFYDALTPVRFEEGERIINKGDEGSVFYIIQEGVVKCHDIGLGDSQFVDQILGVGDWFGERALLTGEPRAANVTAISNCILMAISRETFEATFGSLQEQMKIGIRHHLLKSLPMFANSYFDAHEINELSYLLTEQCFRKDDYLCEVGKPYKQDLWIIESGSILVVHSKSGKMVKLKPGDYFGDKSIKMDPGHISSHYAIFDENTTCLVLTRKDIESVIGDINRLGEIIPFQDSTAIKSINFNDLEKHRILGMGAFGKVWLTSHKTVNEHGVGLKVPYALKQLDKRALIQSRQVKGVIREKDVMYSIKHPFLIHLVCSFQDENSVYLLLELVPGGELFTILHASDKDGLPNDHARFYAACILEALAHLHRRNICYRDIKPENVLIDSQGYCIVADMGFAKVVLDTTYTLCGTPEYLAPEIIMSKGHDKSVDYWSFGVLVYELLVGRSPFYFYGTDQISLFKRIVLVNYEIPSVVNDDAKDMIQKLLVRRQTSRLGNLRNGPKDVQDHLWFKPVNFKKLVKKEIMAPWIPSISDPFDSSHFDDHSRAERETKDHRYKLEAEEQELFELF